MRHSKFSRPQVNAGSMADIAFLLLIFFLVTTTISVDAGINRKLPKDCITADCNIDLHKRNLLPILINANNQIMINDEVVKIEDINKITKQFLDNNGDSSCNYCNGNKFKTLSDNPRKAIISLHTNREANYATFIALQDEITKAYSELRLAYSDKMFNKHFDALTDTQAKQVREAYPFLLSESETK